MKGSYVIHLLSISTMNKLHDTYGSILKRLELTIATHQFYKLSDFSLKTQYLEISFESMQSRFYRRHWQPTIIHVYKN